MVDLVTSNRTYPSTGNMLKLHEETLESSDSDDELLGITDDPICLKTIYKPSTMLNPEENFQNHRRQTKIPQNKSDNFSQDGWIYCGKPRNTRKHSNQWSNSAKGCRLASVIKSNHVDNISMNSWLATKEVKATRKLSGRAKQIEIQNTDLPPGVSIKQSSLGEETTNTDKGWNNISNDYVTPKFEGFLLNTEGLLPKNHHQNENVVPTMEVIDVSTQQSHQKVFHTMNERDQSSPLNRLNGVSLTSLELRESQVKRSFDGFCQSKDKINKYQRMREVRGVTGFIVNVHDATNFDIDLDIVPELHEQYCDVISNQYTYQDLGADFLENPDLNRLRVTPEVGTTYRCRLKGVGINQLSSSEHTWKSNQMCVNVKQLIDRTDGWVTCTLSDIDVYQRLLVDIVIYTSNGPINLRDYLLLRMKDEDNPIFYPYSGQRLHSLSQPFNKAKR